MESFGIIIICILIFLIAAFAVWFFSLKAKGRCPVCAMKKIFIPRKITLDTEEFENYSSPRKAPIMGWSSWNTFRQNIDEDLILQTAEAMRKSGLAEAGYEYINLDDCWQSSLRDKNGRLQADFSNFPSGMPELIKKINEMGLKAGLYTSNGTLTCEDMPASLGREQTDAETLAEWGAELFKYDFCHNNLDSGIAPTIERLDFSAYGEKPFASLCADDARYTGMGRTVSDKKLPSGKGIAFLSHAAGKAKFTLNAPKAGEYVLTVAYRKIKCKKNQYLLVKINGRIFEVFFPATKAPSPTGRSQAIVTLDEGENSIEISNPILNRSDAAFLQYLRMGRELKKATEGKKPIVFSICEWGFNRPYLWGRKAGNMWRTTPDIFAKWISIRFIYSHNIKLWKYAEGGNFNDPDMLEVGNGSFTDAENTAHFTLWCMMAAPLVLGNDIRRFIDADGNPAKGNRTLEIVTNKELIDIDADELGKPAKIVKKGAVDVIARPLANGDTALCFFNKAGGEKKASFNISELKKDSYFSLGEGKKYTSKELWSGDVLTGEKITVSVPKHSVKVFRIRED